MAKSLITILYLVSIMNVSNGQNINLQDLNFIENKIKSNYPSYSNKVNSNYSKILRSAKKNIGKRSNSILNFSQLAIPVLFFKDLHLMLSNLKPISFDSTFCKNKLMEVESKSIKIREFKNGYWKSDYNDCIIYLQECGDKHNLYEAILIESTNKEIKLGSIKFYITKHKFDNYHVTNYINSKGNMFAIYSYFLSKDTLVTGIQYKWTKINDYRPNYLKRFIPIEDKVSLNILDSNFISIKIPRSDLITKQIVDSLVALNKSAIENAPNLIIDIRNNAGGTWAVYKSLFPYIYTNPMIGGEQLRKCSEDFIEKQRQSVEEDKVNKNLTQFLSTDQKELDSMIKYKDAYYYSKPDTIQFDSVKAYPKKIIILTNYRCISASEMFLKFCQQSKKVIIAGEKTWGAVDNVGLISFDSPSGNIRLYIPRTKNFYKKDTLLDFVGINPDIVIPSTEINWSKYIINYLSNRN